MEPSKKRQRTEEEEEPLRTLLMSVFEDGELTLYSVPADLVTQEVKELWRNPQNCLSCIFEDEEEMDPVHFSKLPECIQRWKGQIRRESGEGNWKNAMQVRDWD